MPENIIKPMAIYADSVVVNSSLSNFIVECVDPEVSPVPPVVPSFFEIEGREYLAEIYASIASGMRVVILKSRQVGITELLVNSCLYLATTGVSSSFGSPNYQSSRLVYDRLVRKIQHFSISPVSMDRPSRIVFQNGKGVNLFHSSNAPVMTRGLSSTMIIDEAQHWRGSTVPNLFEAEYPWVISGSSSETQLLIGGLWRASDQRQFEFFCTTCRLYYKPELHYCPSGTLIRCMRCRTETERALAMRLGRWCPSFSDSGIAGFRIHCLMNDFQSIERIREAERNYSQATFKAEYLADL